jgi:hypothetical protein
LLLFCSSPKYVSLAHFDLISLTPLFCPSPASLWLCAPSSPCFPLATSLYYSLAYSIMFSYFDISGNEYIKCGNVLPLPPPPPTPPSL